MKRIASQHLSQWKESSIRNPLILRGARQVGKTHLVRQFGEQFHHFVEINFEKQPEAIRIFDLDLDPKRIIRELSLITGTNIVPGETLLFLDEAQEAPKSILALRYFYEEMPSLHVIAAGSLLDFAIDKVGVPVGRVSFCYLYPMSFIEFLVAYGHVLLAREIVTHNPAIPLNEPLHTKTLRLLGEYMAIGGMPMVVQQWIIDPDIHLCQELLNSIQIAYQDDFSKYSRKKQIKYVDLLYQKLPNFICRRFKYTQLETPYRKRELAPALYLLEKAGINHLIHHSHAQGIPLGAQLDFDRFKVILLDIAVTQSILNLNIKDWFLQPEVTLANKGNIAEAFVGQEMLAYSNPHNPEKLYYWQREAKGSQAEIDYLMVHQSKVIPVEVKSGRGSQLHSLRYFLKTHPDSPYGIRFSVHDFSQFDSIHSYPLYAVANAIPDKRWVLEFLDDDSV